MNMYVSSVRYTNGVYGLPAALKYFFGRSDITPSKSQSFFLVERIGNIHNKFLSNRIKELIRYGLKNGSLNKTDVLEILNIYSDMILNNNIICEQSLFDIWKKELKEDLF